MGASRLLAMKPGFQWHNATGEPPETTSIAKPLDVPPAAPDPLERYLWANKKPASALARSAGFVVPGTGANGCLPQCAVASLIV
jgi:hypothetical protein